MGEFGPEDFGGSDFEDVRTRETYVVPLGEGVGAVAVKPAAEARAADPWRLLCDLCQTEGFTLVVDAQAPDRPDILGQPQRDELCAQACRNNVIAVKPTLPPENAFYAVSHEIAETRLDFSGHHQLLWREQCTVLARWCRRLSRAR